MNCRLGCWCGPAVVNLNNKWSVTPSRWWRKFQNKDFLNNTYVCVLTRSSSSGGDHTQKVIKNNDMTEFPMCIQHFFRWLPSRFYTF